MKLVAARPVVESIPYPPIADYGLISDMHSCALVSQAGSVDWCCFPRFDSPAVFGRLLDWDKGGYFKITAAGVRATSRRYLPDTNVLETTFETESGVARLTDFMAVHPHVGPGGPREISGDQQLVRLLECDSGTVDFSLVCCPRFEYGTIVPHAHIDTPHTAFAHGGADAIALYCSTHLSRAPDNSFVSEGTLSAGESLWAVVSYESRFSHQVAERDEIMLRRRLNDTIKFWEEWSSRCTYKGKYRDHVLRSALTLKGLTYAPSGGLVAAATTSLPERIGGARNWDYRYTWIRDATFALYALYLVGYTAEAEAFGQWLEWSTVGRAMDLQIMYGLGGERRLTECTLDELAGYRGSTPVRVGNDAYRQFQLDIYGEIMDSAHLYRKFVGPLNEDYWEYLLRVVRYVMAHWREPDEGIWESRGGRQHYVFSKVMCWAAMDRAIKAAEALDLPGDVERWHEVREEIREDVLAKGVDKERGLFVQAYGSRGLDASTLMLPLVGFIRADDPRMRATIEAIQRDLTSAEGFVYRYKDFDDGMDGGEGTFNICTLWLADNLVLLGEMESACRLFERLLDHTNELGLLSEQIESGTGAMLGNFPQAFSHMAIINTAVQISRAEKRLAKAQAQQ